MLPTQRCVVDGIGDPACALLDRRTKGSTTTVVIGKKFIVDWHDAIRLGGFRIVVSSESSRTVLIRLNGPHTDLSWVQTLNAKPYFVDSFPEITSVEVSVHDGAGEIKLTEIEIFPMGARTWLYDSATRGDVEVEMLSTYGLQHVIRSSVENENDVAAMIEHAKAIFVANHSIAATTRAQFREFVQRGGVLVELGEVPSICGPPATPVGSQMHWRTTERSANFPENVHWWSAVAVEEPCNTSFCKSQHSSVEVSAVDQEPRVVSISRRAGAGWCHRWLGDVMSNWVRLRQGDKALSDRDVDGITGLQPSDLFAGHLIRSDYDIPSADVWGTLLTDQVSSSTDVTVLLHWLPNTKNSLLLLSADQDYAPVEAIVAQAKASGNGSATLLLTDRSIGGKPDITLREDVKVHVAAQDANMLWSYGQHIGVHPNLLDVPRADYGSILSDHVANYIRQYRLKPTVVRNHHLVWSGYTRMARLQSKAGLILNLDFISAAIRPNGALGFMSASALAARFIDKNGEVLPIYQHATALDDHVLLPSKFGYAVHSMEKLQERSMAIMSVASKWRVPVLVNEHPYWWVQTDGAWQDSLTRNAKNLGIDTWSVGRWLDFIVSRRSVKLIRRSASVDVSSPNTEIALRIDNVERCETVQIDGAIANDVAPWKPLNHSWCIVPVPKGAHRVSWPIVSKR